MTSTIVLLFIPLSFRFSWFYVDFAVGIAVPWNETFEER